MPYITKDDRDLIESIEDLRNPGQLNFYFTEAIAQYIRNRSLSYQAINDVIGALEGAKLEFYARVVRPYEDRKIKENGDVY